MTVGAPADGYRRVFERFAAQRASLVSLVVTVVVLALAVNLVSDAVIDKVGAHLGGAIGLVTLVALGFYAVSRLSTTSTHVYNAFVVAQANGALRRVPRYEYSETAQSFLEICLHTNPELYEAWGTQREQILAEATEFFVLNALATHLDRYSQEIDPRHAEFKPLSHNDLASLRSSNRILEHLSDPESIPVDTEDKDAKLVALVLPGGAIVETYTLHLPQGSTVRRAADGVVTVKTKSVRIKFSTDPADSTFVPPGFLGSSYLGYGSVDQAKVIATAVRIETRVRWRAIIEGRGLKYSRWVDSFLVELEERLDAPGFLQRIGWEHAQTVLLASRQESGGLFPKRTGDDPRPAIEWLVQVLSDAGVPVAISDDHSQFRIQRGSSALFGELVEIDGELAVRLKAQVVREIEDDGSRTEEILRKLNALSLRVPLAQFMYDVESNAVLLTHDAFAATLRPDTVAPLVARISAIADSVDDEIRDSIGTGRLASDPETASSETESVRPAK